MKQKSQSLEQTPECAVKPFWDYGYEAMSMDMLVKTTGASRHNIFSDFAAESPLEG